jgi:hypothetical protein
MVTISLAMLYFPYLGRASEEVTFKDLTGGPGKRKRGYDKIEFYRR